MPRTNVSMADSSVSSNIDFEGGPGGSFLACFDPTGDEPIRADVLGLDRLQRLARSLSAGLHAGAQAPLCKPYPETVS